MRKLIKVILVAVSLFQMSCMPSPTVIELPPIRDVSITMENEAWIVTRHGKVIHLLNSDKKPEEIEFDGTARQVFFLNETEGWILDSAGQIWMTKDKGKNWLKKGSFNHDIASFDSSSNLSFLDTQNGWFINSSSVLFTNDGGTSWKEVYPNQDFSYSKLESQPRTLFPVSPDEVWLGMTNGKALKTVNRGTSWEQISISDKAEINSLFAFNSKEGWMGTWGDGALYYTGDGGKKWQRTPKILGDYGIYSISFANRELGWAVGIEFNKSSDLSKRSNRVVFKTTDGGKSWLQLENEFYKHPFKEVKFTDQNNGWLTGENSVYRTSDGGNSWQKVFEFNSNQ